MLLITILVILFAITDYTINHVHSFEDFKRSIPNYIIFIGIILFYLIRTFFSDRPGV